MKANVLDICPLCEGRLVVDKRKRTIKYKGHKKVIKQTAEYCDSCSEAFLRPEDIKETKLEIADFKRTVDNLLTTDEIKKFRKKFNLTQPEASKIFGGGVRAFSKYERGEVNQTRSTDILIRLLDSGKITLKDIAKFSK